MYPRILLTLLLLCLPALRAQTSISDPAGPVLVSPSATGKDLFILNKDLSMTGRFNAQTNTAITCTPPTGLSAASTTPRTLINDGTDAYFTAQSTTANAAASAYAPGYPCLAAAPQSLAGGVPTQAFTANDPRHGRFYTLSAFAGNGPDTLTTFANINTNTNTSTAISLTQKASVTVDTGATYTGMFTDLTSDYGLTAITELRTSTSPGGLLVYSPGIQTVFRILGPGGAPLPALGAFFMPSPANDNGQLLVLINQDSLTATNYTNPPAVLNPFTIIDLGQLQRAFSAVVSQGTTITLPVVSTVPATTSYYAMLGAVYSPVFHLAYALVAGGTSAASPTVNVIRYDPTNPNAPAETVVADISTIPFTLGQYPQLAFNAAAGTVQILSGGTVYTVPVAGKGNTPTALTGSTFGDSNFKPTSIASNPLLGETYIASSTQVDILGLAATSTKRATIELFSQDNAAVNQSYNLYAFAVNPDSDSTLTYTQVTFTGTPPGGGTPVTLATAPFYQFASTSGGPGYIGVTFPSTGVWTVTATVPATANYPAVTSLPVKIGVGTNYIAPVYPTTARILVPSTSNSTTVTAQLYLGGSTYAPTGRIVVSDSKGNEVGRYTFTGGATSYPVSATLTLPVGTSSLIAAYSGDTQNQPSTSNAASVTVGNQATSSLSLSIPTTATTGATVPGTVFYSAAAGYTGTPTGNILIQTGSTTLATVPVATAFAAPTAGAPFTFTAPAGGTYPVTATYAGDANFSAATSTASSLVVSSPKIVTGVGISGVTTQTANTPFTVTLRLTATGATTTPTGTVTLTAGSNNAVVGTVTAAQAFAVGGAAVQVTLPVDGTYTLTASYPGDSSFAASSGQLVIISKATYNIASINIPSSQPVGNTVTASLTATLSNAVGVPTGNITVLATNMATGAVTTLATVAASTANSSFTLPFSFTVPGPTGLYRVDATYPGDGHFNPATAPTASFSVTTPTTTATSITLNFPATYPPISFVTTVKLTPANALGTPPTGSITLVAIDSYGVSTSVGVQTAAYASSAGGAAFPTNLPSGNYTLKATYPGDSVYGPSSQTGTVVIAQSVPTLSITGPASATTGTATTFTVAFSAPVTPSTGINVSATATGGPGPSTTLPITGGPAVLTFLTPGTYTVTASFAGDLANRATSATFTTVVTGPAIAGFSMTFDDPSATTTTVDLHQNGRVFLPFTLTAINGFNGTLTMTGQLKETSGPGLSSDGFDYALVDSNGNPLSTLGGIQSVVVTPTTGGLHLKLRLSGTMYVGALLRTPTGISFASLFLGLGFLGWYRRRRISPRLAQLLLVVTVIAGTGAVLAGCDSGGNASFLLNLTATPTTGGAPITLSVPVHYTM